MKQIQSIEEMEQFIEGNELALLYITRPQCSVCVAMYPQVTQLLEKYPTIQAGKIDASQLTEISGRLSIFTVPVILLFAQGKEVIRKARFIPMEELEHDISKIVRLINE